MAKWFRHISISRIQFLIGLLFMFALPFNKTMISDFTALWILSWVIERFFKRPYYHKTLPPLLRYSFFGGILFYGLFILGMLFTKNTDSGLFDLQVKLTLILFPIMLYFSNRYYHKFSHLILFSFLFGALVITSVYWIHMIYIGITKHEFPVYYSSFVLLMHTSYFAMYLSLAALIAIYLYERHQIIHSTILLIAILLFFFISIYLTSAKSGLLSILSILFIYFIYLIRNRNRSYRLVFIGVLLTFIPLSLYYIASNPRFKAGLNEIFIMHEVNPHTSSSGTLRLLLWHSAFDLIVDNPFGYGTGDVKEILVEKYKKQDITKAVELKLNTHNQFFETTITIGIIGLLLFLAILITPVIYFSSKKQYWLFPIGFILIIIINFSTESMLNRQAGVIFFAWFYNFIILYLHPNKKPTTN